MSATDTRIGMGGWDMQGDLVEGDAVCVLPPVCNVRCAHGLDCSPSLS